MNRQAIILVGVVGILVLSCDTNAFRGGKQDAPLPPATTILEVRVEPDTVAVGETASFTCIIADSLRPGMKYSWTLRGENFSEIVETSENNIEWIAPSRSRVYRHHVRVRSPDARQGEVNRPFSIVVMPR